VSPLYINVCVCVFEYVCMYVSVVGCDPSRVRLRHAEEVSLTAKQVYEYHYYYRHIFTYVSVIMYISLNIGMCVLVVNFHPSLLRLHNAKEVSLTANQVYTYRYCRRICTYHVSICMYMIHIYMCVCVCVCWWLVLIFGCSG